MKSKMAILAVALSAAMMLPTAFAFASTDEIIQDTNRSGSGIAKPQSGNVSDKAYSFKFASNGETKGTAGRVKEDATSSYIRIDTKTVDSCRVYIDGSLKQSGSRWVNETCYKNTGKVGGYCIANRKGEFAIQNMVKENHYRYARLTGWCNSLPGKLIGFWSPDSVGNFTVLNHA